MEPREALGQQFIHRYRGMMAVTLLVYGAAVAVMFALFAAISMTHQERAGWAALVICLAAVPLEQLTARFPRAKAGLIVAYIVVVAVSFFLLNLRLSIEWVILTLIGAAFISGKLKTFARDWAVFIVVLVAWQVTDGLATKFDFPLHIRAMIDADKIIGAGQVPAVWLQQHLYDPNHVTWLDILGVVVYSLHFLLPLAAGFILWLVNRNLYYRFAIAFSVAAVLGFATYILYPAVPPWMAVMHCPNASGSWACANGQHHFLPWFFHPGGTPLPVNASMISTRVLPAFYQAAQGTWSPGIHDVWNHTMAGWLSKNNGNVAFGPFHMGFDDVGAMPSEHVMYPFLVFLFFRRQFGRAGWLMLPYTALVIFVIAYMGQHYVIDGFVGIVYALAVYALVMHVAPFLAAQLRSADAPAMAPVSAPVPVAASEHEEGLVPVGSRPD